MTIAVKDEITKILDDMGQPTDGSGFWTRNDVRLAISTIQRQISQETGCILASTAALTVTANASEITFDSNGNVVEIRQAYCNDGSETNDIGVYTEEQLRTYDSQWTTRTSGTLRGINTDTVDAGKFRPYPIMTDSLSSVTVRFAKLANAIDYEDEVYISGDASAQLADLHLSGVKYSNTDAYKLYWSLANVTTTRTFSVYKASGKAAGDLVAQGTRSGDGVITLTAQNSSGMTGQVTVAYTIDDTDAANILTVSLLEIQQVDIPVLEHGVKAILYNMERDGKNADKAATYMGLYGYSADGNHGAGLGDIRKRVAKQREGSYRTIQERDQGSPYMGVPLFPNTIT